MGNSPTPPGLIERIMGMVDERIAKFARSAFLRNATISDGGLTIKGGFLRMVFGAFNLFYVGPVSPSLPDGTPQQGFRLRRADGTVALDVRDAFPGVDGTLNQAMTWYDRAGNAVFADDTDSGQGIARPYLSGGFSAKRFADFRYATTSPTWETLCDQLVTKQQPWLQVGLRASMDTAGTTGEVRVLVNGALLGSVTAEGFAVSTRYFGAEAVAGDYGDDLLVEIQGQRTSASGTLRVEPRFWKGRQS